jgi:predicted dienelactone hydrolase
MRVRRFIRAAILLTGSVAAATLAVAADPRQPGPYRVGVRTEVFVDADRTCAITQKPRTLVTEIWYPAADNADDFPRNQFNDFFGREEGRLVASAAMLRFGAQFDKLNGTFKNIARRNAPARDGKFPLLVFSHGNGGFRHQNTFQAEYLASHGYIVAAPDHTGNAALTVLPDQIILYNGLTRTAERRDDRPRDVSFLFTQLARLGADEGHWLAGRISPDQWGAFGHSFGGFTVCRAIELDARIKAILPMTLAGTLDDTPETKPCQVPLLVILGDKDRTVKEKGNERSIAYFERATGPKYLLNFKDAGHFTFTEMAQINPDFGDGIGAEKDDQGKVTLKFSDALVDQRITNEYSVAFFDAFLRNDASARAFLDANQAPDELAYRKE